MTNPFKYKDYYEIVITLTNGRCIKRYGNESDKAIMFGDWPETTPDAIIDFQFTYPATQPFSIRRDLIETIECFRIRDYGQDDPS